MLLSTARWTTGSWNDPTVPQNELDSSKPENEMRDKLGQSSKQEDTHKGIPYNTEEEVFRLDANWDEK